VSDRFAQSRALVCAEESFPGALTPSAYQTQTPLNMDNITAALATATTLFAVVSTLAILVTGFFVGRQWFKKV
jgi:hypothetical protein